METCSRLPVCPGDGDPRARLPDAVHEPLLDVGPVGLDEPDRHRGQVGDAGGELVGLPPEAEGHAPGQPDRAWLVVHGAGGVGALVAHGGRRVEVSVYTQSWALAAFLAL